LEISKVKEISDSLGYTPQKIEVLSQEASDRKYFRLILDTHDYKEFTENWYKYEHNSKLRNRTEPGSNDPCSVIFCFLDPKVGSNKRFVELSNHVHKHPKSIFNGYGNINGLIPKVYAFEDKIGVTIQEDFYESFLEKFPDGFEHVGMDSFPVCDSAFDALVKFVGLDFPDLKNLSSEDLEAQMKRFEDYFLSDLLEINLANFGSQKENLQNLIEETIQNLSLQPWVNCHQDFEVRNLMYRPDDLGEVGIIDFQDTCKGPVGIDLAGIYIDHYNFNFTFAHLKCFDGGSDINRTLADYGFAGIEDQETIYEYAVWGGIQRNLRILGTLSNLYLQNGRTFRLPDLSLILNNLMMIIPDNHQELKDFLRTEVFNLLNKKLEAIL
jgi:aminoglycoside/choline kinase family phosphotransferase